MEDRIINIQGLPIMIGIFLLFVRKQFTEILIYYPFPKTPYELNPKLLIHYISFFLNFVGKILLISNHSLIESLFQLVS